MSQVDLASILSLLSVLDTTLLIELTATTLYLYDYILTFSQEVGCVWNRKFTGASLLFIINRYVVLANRLVRLIQLVSWSGWKEGQADYRLILAGLCRGLES
ncbi:hypothetical protein PsYK624_094760 [Phanerochaete sordida]|uniref:DUF6533 domain-containing protein n=1 Tax=Phanerochaete sordida TaxID=48140 RepID=A0A9P3GEI5_9APHY|nr:hypothetical protein PsYK624_094760 [Phanerochaete sordida]